MKVDWFTVAAQVINFLLLIYLLRHFLYRPVTRAMAQREQAIAARLETAAARQVEAEQGAAEYRKMQQELAAQRDELLVTAREQAEAERRRLVEQARQEVASAQRRWEAALEREREAFLRELSHQVGVRFCAALRGALTDLSGADLASGRSQTDRSCFTPPFRSGTPNSGSCSPQCGACWGQRLRLRWTPPRS